MKITIYMKSGNKITLRNIKEYEFQNRGDDIVGIKLVRRSWMPGTYALAKTFDLRQIEAVTVN